MSKGLSYYFKKTIGYIKAVLTFAKFSVKDILNRLKAANPSFENYPKEISEGKQGKHIEGHGNYILGRSILTISISEAQKLVYRYSGRGNQISENKERVDFNRVIGVYKNPSTGVSEKTTIGIIHYSKTGTHIVPAQPRKR